MKKISELKVGDVVYVGKNCDWAKEIVKIVEDDHIITDRGEFKIPRKNKTLVEFSYEDAEGIIAMTNSYAVVEGLRMLQEQITSSLIDFAREE